MAPLVHGGVPDADRLLVRERRPLAQVTWYSKCSAVVRKLEASSISSPPFWLVLPLKW